jgi:4-hydroxybenzoate polyprenyltransferase
LALAAAIVTYDWRHKQNPLAPLVMGACRGLVYLIAAASVGGPSSAAFAGAAVITAYVVGLTVVARLSGPAARWRVPALLAGISLVDAAFIWVVSASLPLALLAAVGFPLTLALQRFVPGD